LTENDLVRAAEFLGMSAEAFEKRYVYRTRRLLRLRTPRDLRCHFLREGGCAIHPAKPTQCRLFPFWPEMVEDRREWRKTAAWCPGIGKGALVQIETARQDAAEMRTSYPGLY
jgi:Fe-S-cluster containining protein